MASSAGLDYTWGSLTSFVDTQEAEAVKEGSTEDINELPATSNKQQIVIRQLVVQVKAMQTIG